MEVLEQLLQDANSALFTTGDYEVNSSIIEVIKTIENEIKKLKEDEKV